MNPVSVNVWIFKLKEHKLHHAVTENGQIIVLDFRKPNRIFVE